MTKCSFFSVAITFATSIYYLRRLIKNGELKISYYKKKRYSLSFKREFLQDTEFKDCLNKIRIMKNPANIVNAGMLCCKVQINS